MEIKVREYDKKDFDGVNIMLYEAFRRLKKIDISEDENFHEVVAECNGRVVGYLLLTKVLNPIRNRHYYIIDYVCVVRDFRGYGVGEKMMEYAEEYARHCGGMYLQLTCRWTRIEAHKLYEKCGFVKRESDIFRKELI